MVEWCLYSFLSLCTLYHLPNKSLNWQLLACFWGSDARCVYKPSCVPLAQNKYVYRHHSSTATLALTINWQVRTAQEILKLITSQNFERTKVIRLKYRWKYCTTQSKKITHRLRAEVKIVFKKWKIIQKVFKDFCKDILTANPKLSSRSAIVLTGLEEHLCRTLEEFPHFACCCLEFLAFSQP